MKPRTTPPHLGLLAAVPMLIVLGVGNSALGQESTCFGSTSNGALEGACQLPAGGQNFRAYSTLGIWLGRTYVHCSVAEVVRSAYLDLAEHHPSKVFVYAETGFRGGGQFKPHRTHQNGLSVDFMVPVLDEKGESVPLPTGLTNKFGYGLEFDSQGRLDDLRIDFDAIVAHLTALKLAAGRSGIGIWRVIFDPQLQPGLKRAPGWPAIQDLQFSTRRSWVRHDEHYHVDFAIPCKPL